jgi:cytochrome c oxidase subunit II
MVNSRYLYLFLWILAAAIYDASPALADWTFNLSPGVTPISQDIYRLHTLVFWICAAIGTMVSAVLFYTLIRYRKSRGVKPAKFHEHPVLEITWATIPFLILIGIAIPTTRVLMRIDDTREAELTIKITGYQWRWHYAYLDQGIQFFSNLSTPQTQIQNTEPKNPFYLLEVDHPLVVPIRKKIRFLFTSNDVIHSWWVPALGIKRDTLPGFINEAWATIDKPGIYRGQCAELCGTNHAFMPIVVQAVDESRFEQWVRTRF